MPAKIVSPVRVARRGRRHVFACESGELGVLETSRESVIFRAGEGLPLVIRREPGITASHHQMWNLKGETASEFYASSYRWSVWTRDIRVHYGNNDYALVARAGFGRGYDLVDNKNKRILSLVPDGLFSRSIRIDVDKAETELACIVFAYYLASSTWLRSFWNAPSRAELADRKVAQDAATKAATAKAAELAQAMMPGNVPKAGLERTAPSETPKTPAATG